MEQNEFRIELIIYTGDDHPDTITEALNIKPTKTYVKGEQKLSQSNKPIFGKKYEDNIWIYSTNKLLVGQDERTYIDTCIRDLLMLLGEKKEKVREVLLKYQSSYFGCYAYYYDSHVYFKINKTLLKELSYYETDIVFDSYNFANVESEQDN